MASEITPGTRVIMIGTLDKQVDGNGWAVEGAWLVTTPMVCTPDRVLPLDDLREVLRTCEWSAETSAGVPQCPVCYHTQEVVHLPDEMGTIVREPGYHAGDCELAALLSQLGGQG